MEIKVLFIEDNEKLSFNLQKFYNGESVSGNTIIAKNVYNFKEGISQIEKSDFDIVVLDLNQDGENQDAEAGIKVLNRIREVNFIPVIFYTGYAYKIDTLKSEIVGVVNKGEGFDNLTTEIKRIVDSKIALLKIQIYSHLRESLKQYFWDTIDAKKDIFIPGKSEVSLGYLLLRRFASSLSKENIKKILGDDKIKVDRAHPMEFYIFPVNTNDEFQSGDILSKEGICYTILTPSCDFIQEGSRTRKVGKVLLARAIPLKSTDYYKKWESNKEKYKQNLCELIESRKGDRYFFLPGTLFIENYILDFQDKTMVDYSELKNYTRIAKLDDPFAQSMVTSFIRYYNRIGFPDLDSEYIIQNLK
jgi:CheY-like chemotaxis protein